VNLRIPGPTPLPGAVLEVIGQQMINHRGSEFETLFKLVTERLQLCFQTRNDVLILTGSGTGGLEAAIANLISPGDRVLAVTVGTFGERWVDIAKAFGADVTCLDFPRGEAADPAAIEEELTRGDGYSLLLVTHNETSTGVTNDVAAIAQAVHSLGEKRPLLAVDAVSSLGAIDLPVDALGLDVVVTASQKAWMAPPGLAMVSVSPSAWEAVEKAQAPRFYWDFKMALRYAGRGQTPATPAISILFGLNQGLALILAEGLPNVFERHHQLSSYLRNELRKLGLELLAADACASNTVTAVKLPSGVDGKEFVRRLRAEHGVEVAGGQGPLAGKIFRVAHMGFVTKRDLEEVIEGLAAILKSLSEK
jgi:aspartate aminotransferase-like enzyme